MSVTNYYFLVLDIETSTLFNDKKEPTATWLSYGYCNLYNREGNNVQNCYFRKWGELDKFLSSISRQFKGKEIFCYVHNLAYEFDYLIKNISRPKKFLTNATHAVISCILEKYHNITFRCSLRLTMKSLRSLGESLGFNKLDSDYRFILPSDEVTEEEKEYCLRDCDVVAKYVSQSLLKEYNTFNNTPLTKTGRVRKQYKQFYNNYKQGVEVDWDLYPNEDCYEALNNAFSGGITISNPMFTGIVIKDVTSYDITSSYPFAQLSELFPYTIRKEYNPPSKPMLSEKFWIAKIKFSHINSKFNWGWLSISKMQDYDAVNSIWFNGKLISSFSITRTITNIDYEMICKTYDFDSIEILEFYHCDKYGELPQPYIDCIDLYAREKYRLKQETKKIDESSPNYLELNMEYMNAKGDFNSIYGMTVQKIMQEEYEITDIFSWRLKDSEYKKKDGHLQRNFLFGVYTTAYARRNLLTAIIKNCPDTFIYADTDSIKYFGNTPFVDTNKQLPKKYLEKEYLAKLGRFDLDAHYTQFITYGAKKYAYTHDDLHKVYMTVAGLPKVRRDDLKIYDMQNKKRLDYGTENDQYFLLNIEDFKLNTLFFNCKLGKKYMTSEYTYDAEDLEYISNCKQVDEETKRYLKKNKIATNGGVALYPTSYLLDITKEDRFYLNEMRKGYDIWIKAMERKTSIPLTKYLNMMSLTEL